VGGGPQAPFKREGGFWGGGFSFPSGEEFIFGSFSPSWVKVPGSVAFQLYWKAVGKRRRELPLKKGGFSL